MLEQASVPAKGYGPRQGDTGPRQGAPVPAKGIPVLQTGTSVPDQGCEACIYFFGVFHK